MSENIARNIYSSQGIINYPTQLHVVGDFRISYDCLPEDEPTRFETGSRQQKLNINLEKCAFRWFVLYNYIIVHGAKKHIKLIFKFDIQRTVHRHIFL